MNERIRELAEQARYDSERVFNREISLDEYQEIYDKKFAELIVRECIDAATEAQADFYVVHNIKTRFGVE